MRKLLFLLILLIAGISSIYSRPQDGSGSSNQIESPADVLVYFNSPGLKERFVLGFAYSESIPEDLTVNSDITALTDVTLHDSDNNGIASNMDAEDAKPISVFYQISSLTSARIYLGLNSPLVSEKGNELDWTISSISWGEERIASEGLAEDSESKKEISYHDASKNVRNAGSVEIEIATLDYFEKPADEYIGYIYMTIETVGGQ